LPYVTKPLGKEKIAKRRKLLEGVEESEDILERVSSLFPITLSNKEDIIKAAKEKKIVTTPMGTKVHIDASSKNNYIWDILLQRGGNEAVLFTYFSLELKHILDYEVPCIYMEQVEE
jgi:hypothetical protein